MENRSREEVLAEKIIKTAGLEKPSVNFSANVLKAIADRQRVTEYKPLISPGLWVAIAVVVLVTLIGLSMLTSGSSVSSYFSFMSSIAFPQWNLSRTMIYAIAFVSLFFLEIPFLKRFLVKQYD
ncbi:hypothetical protein [Zunongwangia sp. H14]|uniref:hypothetical protein n=1 Tax=Zunongwangia sp. H14 TaxID=3240792 RepID=UPI00356751A0